MARASHWWARDVYADRKPFLKTRTAITAATRHFFASVPHPARGAVRVTASPYHIDGEPVHPRGPAAYRVGEHTRAVLGDLLGYSPERIAELARQGIIDAP